MKKKTLIVQIAAAFLFLHAYIPAAGQTSVPLLYTRMPTFPLTPGSTFTVKILIDSNTPLNAYELRIRYPANLMEIIEFHTGHSVIDVWQTEPHSIDGFIEAVGVGLQPFQGVGGEIMEIQMRATSPGPGEFYFENAAVYAADGEGTAVTHAVQNQSITVLPGGGAAVNADLPGNGDTIPPIIQEVSFTPDPADRSRMILGYQVKDELSAIEKIEIRTKKWLWWSSWATYSNPTALPRSIWRVQIRAQDSMGNISEAYAYSWRNGIRQLGAPFLILSGLLCALFIIKKQYN